MTPIREDRESCIENGEGEGWIMYFPFDPQGRQWLFHNDTPITYPVDKLPVIFFSMILDVINQIISEKGKWFNFR